MSEPRTWTLNPYAAVIVDEGEADGVRVVELEPVLDLLERVKGAFGYQHRVMDDVAALLRRLGNDDE